METDKIIERAYCPQTTKYYEGMFTQGSGYLSVRGSYEEGLSGAAQNEEYLRLPANVTLEEKRDTKSKWGVYLPGVVGIHPALKEEIINLPFFWDFQLYADEERLDMENSEISGYMRMLELKTGELKREFVWHTKSGMEVAMYYNRVIDFCTRNICVQRIEMQVLNGGGEVKIFSGIDGDIRTNGYDHFKKINMHQTQEGHLHMEVETDFDRVWMETLVLRNGNRMERVIGQDRYIAFEDKIMLSAGDSVCFDKITVVGCSRDKIEKNLSMVLEETAKDAERIWKRNRECWAKKWDLCDIHIYGDERAQLALRFSIYHLLRCNVRDDGRVGICAKGHAGEAYFGRCFWDTEIFMLPFYIYTDPEAAKNLLMFRYNTLKGAKGNARLYGYEGARYAWESSIGGEEQCAAWNYCDHEIHITADIVYALIHYYKATGDYEFIEQYGVDIMVETSRYWRSRVYAGQSGEYELKGVMGPDEYLMLTDNDAYTNAMVKFALTETADYLEWLYANKSEIYRKVVGRLNVRECEAKEFREIADRLKQQTDADLILQCDHFKNYEDVDFKKIWKDKKLPFGAFISQERNYRSKALKQASVLQLMYQMPWLFEKRQMERAYDYYLPMTTHDSSLSAGVHALVAAWLDREKDSQDFLNAAIDVDLNPQLRGTEEGIHIANCGILWQFVVFGAAGWKSPMGSLKHKKEGLCFFPHIPEGWEKIEFKIQLRKKTYSVMIDGDKVIWKPL